MWEYRPNGDDGHADADLRVGGRTQLDAPDNLAVSPQGALLLCEDGGGEQYCAASRSTAQIFDFAKNIQNDCEWAGATFAEADPSWNDRKIRGNNRPLGGRWDRVTLFVNRQGSHGRRESAAAGDEGMTFAIWGPWETGRSRIGNLQLGIQNALTKFKFRRTSRRISNS